VIDELQLVRELRAAVPARDDAARRRARARLRTHASRPARRARRLLVLPGVAAAVAAVAVALVAAAGVGREPGAAAAALRQAAARLRAAPAPVLGQGQYWYVESRGHTLTSIALAHGQLASALMTTVHREWIGRDGSGRITRTDSDPQWVTPQDRERWQAAGSPALGGPGIDEPEPPGQLTFPFGSRSLSYAELRALPTDVDALAALVHDASVADRRSRAWEELDLIAELLRNAPLSPGQGAALYQVAARLPGIELLGPTTDPSGRPGVGVAVEDGGLRQELVLDPQTGVLLGDRQVALSTADLPAGTVVEAVSYVRSGVVDGVTQSP
jgi:hypothetical protein